MNRFQNPRTLAIKALSDLKSSGKLRVAASRKRGKVRGQSRPERGIVARQGAAHRSANPVLDALYGAGMGTDWPGTSTLLRSRIRVKGHPDDCPGSCCRPGIVTVAGAGLKEARLPTVTEVVQFAEWLLSRLPVNQAGGDEGSRQSEETPPEGTVHIQSPKAAEGKADASTLPAGGSYHGFDEEVAKFERMRGKLGAELVRQIFEVGKYHAAVADKFDRPLGAENWARNHLGSELIPTLDSIKETLQELVQLYRDSIPVVITLERAKFPNASQAELEEAALAILDQHPEIARVLFVIEHYTRACEQMRDGRYVPLQAVARVVKETHNLFVTGHAEGIDGDAEPVLHSDILSNPNQAFLAYAGRIGPATIPGGAVLGPLGANLILVPQDEVETITIWGVLYNHEYGHDLEAMVKALEEEIIQSILAAIKKAYEGGKLKLSSEFVKIAGKNHPLIAALAKLFVDNQGEIFSDLAAGIELSGQSFGIIALHVFGGLNSRHGNAITQDQLLREYSTYKVTDKGHLEFEVHTPDFPRLSHLLPCALEKIGFPKEAARLRLRAELNAGSRLPEYITWHDEDGKRKPIKIKVSDIAELIPYVVDAVLFTPLKALKGKTFHEWICWNERREHKAQRLRQIMVDAVLGKGECTLPQGEGDFFGIYVMAANGLAFDELLTTPGVDLATMPLELTRCGLKLLDEVEAQQAARKAARQAKAAAPAGAVQPVKDSDQTGASPEKK